MAKLNPRYICTVSLDAELAEIVDSLPPRQRSACIRASLHFGVTLRDIADGLEGGYTLDEITRDPGWFDGFADADADDGGVVP